MRTYHKINYPSSQNQLNASSMMRKLIVPNFAVDLKILARGGLKIFFYFNFP